MKKLLLISLLTIGIALPGFAQRGQPKAYLDDNGEPVYEMQTVYIVAIHASKKRTKQIEKDIRKFNRLVHNVYKVYPYANEAAKNLKVINAEMAHIQSEEARKAYKKSRESFLFGKYEEDLKDLTMSQGKVLIKLIDRQTGSTTYSLVQDLKSPTAAFFWQGIGRLFGYNLKEEYNTENEVAIEVIVKSIENGSAPSYYDYMDALAAR